jgi:putative transposase
MIIPGAPHHVTQRGNRRERIFLEPGDEAIYLDLMRARLERHGVACWAYCLMPNHVHFILTPTDETGLARAVGEAHRRYTAFIGARGRWTGHLFQGRFSSVAMDEDHLMAAFRYVALNPVKAGLARAAPDWPWSSTPAHIAGRSTPYVDVAPALARIDDFAAYVSGEDRDVDARWSAVLKAEVIGRPVGAPDWVRQWEQRLGQNFSPRKRGPKPRAVSSVEPQSAPLFDN